MGSTISCSINGILFSSTEKHKNVKKRLIQAVVKEQNSYYADYDFTSYETVCSITNRGLQYHGSIRYGTQTGSFTIDKEKLVQRLCKC